MAEYIDREALLKDIEESVVFTVRSGKPSLEIRGANAITDRIKSAPAADVEEVKHGRWKLNKDGSGTCDQCNSTQVAVWDFDRWQNFCGVCGAKMDGGKENEPV